MKKLINKILEKLRPKKKKPAAILKVNGEKIGELSEVEYKETDFYGTFKLSPEALDQLQRDLNVHPVFGRRTGASKFIEDHPLPNPIPHGITKDNVTGVEYASFNYYEGIWYTKAKGMKQATSSADLSNPNRYIVSCGDVMVRVEPTDFPEIERQII